MAIDETKLNNRVKWQEEAITMWGQRIAPPKRTILVKSPLGHWSEIGASPVSEADTIGVYLGDNVVMAFLPLKVE